MKNIKKTINNIEDKFTKCTGCEACINICPQKCITLTEQKKGFLYPEIDETKCVGCEKCIKCCPINSCTYKEHQIAVLTFKNADSIRACSTSGGFFAFISEYVLAQNGVVYGAVFDKDFTVMHIRGENVNDRNRMMHSKYVQSKIGNCYKLVKTDLINEVPVLFTGTPCQISGLNNYLLADNIPTDKLITCDIICHGVPSPVVWKDYLSYIENKYNDRIQEINFREKELGWHRPRLQIIMHNNMQLLDEKKDIFYQLFYSNCILRPSCHSCQYTSVNRVSDITMADCWGIEISHPEMDDNKGLSLLLINSEKGMQIIRDTNVKVSGIDLTDVRQPHLYCSAKMSRKREAFWRDYQKMTFIKVVKKYCNITMKNKMINYFKGLLVKVLKR